MLRSLEPDQRVTVRVRRDGDVRSVNMAMGEKKVEKWVVTEKTKTKRLMWM